MEEEETWSALEELLNNKSKEELVTILMYCIRRIFEVRL